MNAQTFIAKTQSIFSDNAAGRFIGGQSSGPKMDQGRLGLLSTGNMRVFRRKGERTFKHWRVELLVDVSGSIYKYGRSARLIDAFTAILKALRAAGIGAVTVSGFNAEAVELESILNDRPALDELFMNAYQGSGSGGYGNHDGHFVRERVKALHAAKEPGRMLVVFSDGNPSCDHAPCGKPGCSSVGYYGREGLKADLIKALDEARRKGVLALAVGVQADHVKEFYGAKHSTSINDLSELFTKTAALIERHIIRG